MKTNRDDYRRLIERFRDAIRSCVPGGTVIAVVSRGDDDLVRMDGYRAWHYPRGEWGEYAGHHPATSAEALVHLRRLYRQGARYLAFPATSTWWLEHYRELSEHLEANHAALLKQDGVGIIYQLRESSAFDAFEVEDLDEWPPASDQAAADLIAVLGPSAPSRPRVLTILARHGTEQYQGADRAVAELFERQMPDVARTSIVVDNAMPRATVSTDASSVLLGSDNSSREFSAFDRAVDFVGEDIWSYDFVHFATSAFHTLYVEYLQRFDTDLLRAAAGHPVCLGHVDCYDEPIAIDTFTAQHWMRSCFFFLNPADVKLLGSFVSVPANRRLFSGDPADPFAPDAPVSDRYRRYITDWLTGGGVGQGVVWHSRFALSGETLPEFEQKTRAILNEQLLSIRLQALGCRLVDVTWMSTLMRRGVRDIPWSTPWQQQLAERDRDARRSPTGGEAGTLIQVAG